MRNSDEMVIGKTNPTLMTAVNPENHSFPELNIPIFRLLSVEDFFAASVRPRPIYPAQSDDSSLKVYADHQFWNDPKFNRYELKRYILFHSEYLRSFCRVLIRPFRKKWSNRINFKKYTAWNIWPDIFGILSSFCCSLFSYHIQMVYTDDTRNLWLSRRWPI